jgi:hypothetical protein
MKPRSFSMILALLPVLGCQEPETMTPRHAVTISVESTPGTPLPGVEFDVDGTVIGLSDQHGLIHTMLEGREGTTIDIHHTCPEGTTSESDTKSLALISFQSVDPSANASGLQMTVRCTPNERSIAFIINADGFANLPVLIDGDEVARTDESGLAHILMDSLPNRNFQVQIATADFDRLRPENPQRVFTLGLEPEIFVYTPGFTELPPPRVRRRRRRRAPTSMIVRLGPRRR